MIGWPEFCSASAACQPRTKDCVVLFKPKMQGVNIPILSTPPNFLKTGPTQLRTEGVLAHPVQKIQKEAFANARQQSKVLAANTFGSHIAMQMDMEETILARCRRPFLPNGLVGLEALLGADEEIDFCDFMSAPNEMPVRRVQGPQAYDD